MKVKSEDPPPKISIPKTTAPPSSNSSVSSLKPVQSLPTDLPKDISILVDSVFASRKIQATSAIGTNGSNTTVTTIPDWQKWWNDVSKDAEVSFIFNSCMKSIMNGAYKVASQRVYDTAVRKKNSSAKPVSASTPTISNNSHRRVNNLVHPERRSNAHSRDIPYDYAHHHYHHHNNNRGATHGNGGPVINANPLQSSKEDRRLDDRQPYFPSRGANDYYSKDRSFNSRRESHHHSSDRRHYSDDDSYSYSSRGRHHDRHHHHYRKRHDLPHSKEDHIATYENDHRSLASSISTKPTIGAIPNSAHEIGHKHHYSHEEYIERDDRRNRRQQQHRRRRRSNSGSSKSDRTRSSDGSSRHRSHRRSHDDYDRNYHKRYDNYDRDRRHHGHRHDDYLGYENDTEPDTRRRNRGENGSQRDDNVVDATKGRELVSSSRSHRNSRSSDSHSRSKDSRPAEDGYNSYNDRGRNSQIEPDDSRHSIRRYSDSGNNRSDDRYRHQIDIRSPDTREELSIQRERKHEELLDRHHDKRNERQSNGEMERQQRKDPKAERNGDRSSDGAGILPIAEVTTKGGDDEVDGKKRDRRYSTPSPRKSRKSKHRKSSTHHKSDNNSDSDSSRSSASSSPSHRRSRRHGSSSSRKHRRREHDGTDSENNAVSSSSPRKRSSRKRRRKSHRNRSTKERGHDEKGAPATDNTGYHRSKVEKRQLAENPEQKA